MKNTINFLIGKKTYILVGIGAVLWVCNALGYISTETFNQLITLLGIGTAGTIRSAIK